MNAVVTLQPQRLSAIVDALTGRALARFAQDRHEQQRVEKRLANWRRWLDCYGQGGDVATCGSAERAYRPEKLTEAESEARTRAVGDGEPINVTDAYRVDTALHQLPKRTAHLLRAIYYRALPPWKICRALDLEFVSIEPQRLLALLLLQRRLSLIDQLALRGK